MGCFFGSTVTLQQQESQWLLSVCQILKNWAVGLVVRIYNIVNLTREKLKQPLFGLTIHWRLSKILKRSNKSVSSNIFWYVKVYIFCIIQYATHWDKTQMLKKYPWDKINVSKVLFFLLRVPAHLSFTFN